MRPVGNNKPKLIIAHLFGSLVLLSFIWTIATGLVPLSFGEVSRSVAVAGEGKSSRKTPAAQGLTPPPPPSPLHVQQRCLGSPGAELPPGLGRRPRRTDLHLAGDHGHRNI